MTSAGKKKCFFRDKKNFSLRVASSYRWRFLFFNQLISRDKQETRGKQKKEDGPGRLEKFFKKYLNFLDRSTGFSRPTMNHR
jgi:hypothetical protein